MCTFSSCNCLFVTFVWMCLSAGSQCSCVVLARDLLQLYLFIFDFGQRFPTPATAASHEIKLHLESLWSWSTLETIDGVILKVSYFFHPHIKFMVRVCLVFVMCNVSLFVACCDGGAVERWKAVVARQSTPSTGLFCSTESGRPCEVKTICHSTWFHVKSICCLLETQYLPSSRHTEAYFCCVSLYETYWSHVTSQRTITTKPLSRSPIERLSFNPSPSNTNCAWGGLSIFQQEPICISGVLTGSA